ncbi:MAG: antitoxin family protein [Pirellulales bacterium]|nr:antitoxin family protein [Pirellulales bacterium]
MTTTVEAIYEQGILRPLTPLDLPEGQRVQVLLATDRPAGGQRSADILAEIASLPLEAPVDPHTSRNHDQVLYGADEQP